MLDYTEAARIRRELIMLEGSRTQRTITGVGCATWFLAVLVVSALRGWLLMVGLGVAASILDAPELAIGYGPSYLMAVLLGFVMDV